MTAQRLPYSDSLSHVSSPTHQRNPQHLPCCIASHSNSASPSLSTAPTSFPFDTVSSPSAWGGQDPLFYRNPEAQIDALIALPEAERREKARVLAASRAQRVCQLRDLTSTFHRMRPHLRSEACAKHVADLAKASYTDYLLHLCVTFRFNELPTELLTEIFHYAIFLTPYDVDLKAATRLTHVCRLWRSVMIGDRRIWNPVCFGNPKYFDRTFALMGRAGPTNIDIRIRDTEDKPLSKDAMIQLIDRLFLQLPSIRKLDIFLYNREAVVPILDGLRQHIPRCDSPLILEYIEIHSFYSPGVAAEFFPSLPLFGGVILPSFRHLRLDGVNIQWEVGLLSRLTTLDLRRIAMELLPSSVDFRAVLSGANGLEKMILDGAGPKHEGVRHPHRPVTIPSLRILVLGGLSDSYAEYVLSHFITPNVLDLTIMFPMHNIYTKLLTCLATTSRMPKVKILNLVKTPANGLPIPNDSRSLLARWLESMPELVFIRLLRTSSLILQLLSSEQVTPSLGTIDVSTGLDKRVRQNVICPQVVYLDYQNDLVDFDILTTWIAHRRRMGYPLRKVWVAPDIVRRLEAVQKVQLWDALGGLGVAQPTGNGRTMEEEAMCKHV